jgi:hypothetical protein
MKVGVLPTAKPTTGEFRTLDAYLVDALGIPFELKYLKRPQFYMKTAEAVNDAITRYEGQFVASHSVNGRFPYRSNGEVRVGIFKQERVGGRIISPTTYIGDIRPTVKSALLFCHSALVPTPTNTPHSHIMTADQYLEWKFKDLQEIFSYGALIPHRIIIPIPMVLYSFSEFDNPWTMPYGAPNSQVVFPPEEGGQ